MTRPAMTSARAADLRDEIALTFDRIEGVAELIGPVLDATCANPHQRRMLETLAVSLEVFAKDGRALVDQLAAAG